MKNYNVRFIERAHGSVFMGHAQGNNILHALVLFHQENKDVYDVISIELA